MPKLLNFKTKSVVYFQGDLTSHFYVLRRGSVSLSSDYSKVDEIVAPGHFFGTQAGLIGLPQDETAIATLPSEILVFTYKEFIQLLTDNRALLTSMLTNFTGELTNIHDSVVQLMNKARQDDNEANTFEISLFKTANFFLKSRAYPQAVQSYATYIQRFPSGQFIEQAKEKLEYAKAKVGSPEDMSEKLYQLSSQPEGGSNEPISPMQEEYNELLLLVNQKKFSQALLKLTKLTYMHDDKAYPSLIASCYYLQGEILVQMEKFHEAIEPLEIYTREYNQSEDIEKAWLYLALAYEKSAQEGSAIRAYEELLQILPSQSPMRNKINTTLENLRKK